MTNWLTVISSSQHFPGQPVDAETTALPTRLLDRRFVANSVTLGPVFGSSSVNTRLHTFFSSTGNTSRYITTLQVESKEDSRTNMRVCYFRRTNICLNIQLLAYKALQRVYIHKQYSERRKHLDILHAASYNIASYSHPTAFSVLKLYSSIYLMILYHLPSSVK